MRPLPGAEAAHACIGDMARFSRPRGPGTGRDTSLNTGPSNQMSFFLAEEAMVDSYLEQPSFLQPRESRKGIEPASNLPPPRDADSHAPASSSGLGASSTAAAPSPASVPSLDPSCCSRPITPILSGPQCVDTSMSSPSSRRHSISSFSDPGIGPDEGEAAVRDTPESRTSGSGSAPQLIMPSLRMPSRRPFTEAGKQLGRLKVLIAGDSGVGKTSLVQAIVQVCQHIVHVDPIGPQDGMGGRRVSKATEVQETAVKETSKRSLFSSTDVSEIFASTKPYPDWWSPLDEAGSKCRRKSLGDSVLERNVCFIDTPGYRSGSSAVETIAPCVEYVESHLRRLSSDTLSDSDTLKMLSGDGGVQVDVVLYLIHDRLKPADVEYLCRLAPLTNVVPLLAQADRLSAEQVHLCKRQITGQLQDCGINYFAFDSMPVSVPYAVSSTAASDHQVMDASLLMSPDYIQPLVPTELAALVEQVFSPNGSSWLRHSAVKKYISWRKRDGGNVARPEHLYQPPRLTEAGSAPTRTSGALIRPSSLALLARQPVQADQQRPSPLQIVDWAADLQRSLSKERVRSEAIGATTDRQACFSGKLGTCVVDGSIVAVSNRRECIAVSAKDEGPKRKCRGMTRQHQDPLGLLQIAADLRLRGWAVLEALGTLGVLGGIYWLTRQKWSEASTHTMYVG